MVASVASDREFQSTLPVRRGTITILGPGFLIAISIHPPRGGRDGRVPGRQKRRDDFNPPSPWGEGRRLERTGLVSADFNPPSPWGEGLDPAEVSRPVGGGTFRQCTGRLSKKNFNPPSPWGEGPKPLSFRSAQAWYFNPPSPWGEGRALGFHFCDFRQFQSTLPVGGGTCMSNERGYAFPRFQSTLPVGGGTPPWKSTWKNSPISIHPPRGGRDAAVPEAADSKTISIHPPRGGRDLRLLVLLLLLLRISIHPPRGGRDYFKSEKKWGGKNFNPPSPWGEGPVIIVLTLLIHRFQSTLPVGGGT